MAFSPPVARLVTTAFGTLFCRFPTLEDNTSGVEHNSASLEDVLASLEDASAQLEGVLAQLEDVSAQKEMTPPCDFYFFSTMGSMHHTLAGLPPTVPGAHAGMSRAARISSRSIPGVALLTT